MSDDYTPTTEDVRRGYAADPEAEYRDPIGYPAWERQCRAMFDRWLAQYTAQKRAEWEAEQGEVLTGEIRAVEFDDGKPRDPDECWLEDCECPEHNYPPRREGTYITVRLDGGFDGAGSWRVAIRRVPVEQERESNA